MRDEPEPHWSGRKLERPMIFDIQDKHFVACDDGSTTRTLQLHAGDGSGSVEWHAKQSSSLSEYQHEIEAPDAETMTLYKLFRGYIASVAVENLQNLDRAKLLDVGCGISPHVPEYVGGLAGKLTYIGLDPFPVNPKREYLFLQGMLEGVAHRLADHVKFDLFVFSTSLDHFESISVAAETVKSLAAPNAYCVFFVGLHDVDLVAEIYGRGIIKHVFRDLSRSSLAVQAIRTSLIRLPRIRSELSRRRRLLEQNQPLDDKHFYYFTRNNIVDYLRQFGTITDSTAVPGTNALFACCKVT